MYQSLQNMFFKDYLVKNEFNFQWVTITTIFSYRVLLYDYIGVRTYTLVWYSSYCF